MGINLILVLFISMQNVILKETEEKGMLVVASSAVEKKQRIYHKYGCIYARRIKADNRIEISSEQAERRHYKKCKYCSGLKGDVKVHKTAFATWSRKKNMSFTYKDETHTLYIQTEIGFWKVFLKEDLGMYLLYHRNSYIKGMEFWEAVNGDFHRQSDVKATESMEKIVEYIIAHDRAKVTIMDDYRKLPTSTKKQKQYFKAAKKREDKKAARRLDSLFLMIENQEGIKNLSYY